MLIAIQKKKVGVTELVLELQAHTVKLKLSLAMVPLMPGNGHNMGVNYWAFIRYQSN